VTVARLGHRGHEARVDRSRVISVLRGWWPRGAHLP
jgi:hypothetical protein